MRRSMLVPLLIALSATSLVAAGPPSVAAPAPPVVQQTALWGGGFATSMVVKPGTTNTRVIGGDVWGFGTTPSNDANGTSQNQLWRPANNGLTDTNQLQVASLAYSANSSNVYAAVGNNTVLNSGLLRSTNDGGSWTKYAWGGGPTFDPSPFTGNQSTDLVDGQVHPRSVGSLLALNETNRGVLNYAFAGSFMDGLFRYRPSDSSWKALALTSGSPNCTYMASVAATAGESVPPTWVNHCFIRTVVADPANPNRLFVGTYGDGAFVMTYTPGSDTVSSPTPIASLPKFAEEFSVDATSGKMYCACGPDGVYVSSSPYTSWSAVGTGMTTGSSVSWNAVAATGGLVYAGATWDGSTTGPSVMSKAASSNTWTDRTSGAGAIDPTVSGTSTTWWLKKSNAPFLLGGSGYKPTAIWASGTQVIVLGRSGAWRSVDSGATWNPFVWGLGGSLTKQIAIPANDGQRLYTSAADWTFFYSADAGATIASKDGGASASDGYAVSVDDASTAPVSPVYLGTGSNGDPEVNGDVVVNADPNCTTTMSCGQWSSTGLDTAAGTTQVVGVGVGHQGNATVTIAVQRDGDVWRNNGSSWGTSPVLQLGSQAGFDQVPVTWPGSSGQYVFLLDRANHKLYRSSDYGQTWSVLWVLPTALDATSGFLASDKTATNGRLWITTADSNGLYRLNNANTTSSPPTLVPVTNLSWPGPITVRANGSAVYLVTRTAAGGTATLWKFDTVANKWSSTVAGNFSGRATFARDIAASGAGVFIATYGSGVVKVTGF